MKETDNLVNFNSMVNALVGMYKVGVFNGAQEHRAVNLPQHFRVGF